MFNWLKLRFRRPVTCQDCGSETHYGVHDNVQVEYSAEEGMFMVHAESMSSCPNVEEEPVMLEHSPIGPVHLYFNGMRMTRDEDFERYDKTIILKCRGKYDG